MGKQYKSLTDRDIEFIKKQKVFYIASCAQNEVNLSPKGYDSIRILSNSQLLFMGYGGSGNRTHRDILNDGEFTLLFNAFEGDAKLLRLFCKAEIIERKNEKFSEYASEFDIPKSQVRDFFVFNIYAVESSCGMAVPFMDYKEDREEHREWIKKMDKNEKLQEYNEQHSTPPNLHNLK